MLDDGYANENVLEKETVLDFAKKITFKNLNN